MRPAAPYGKHMTSLRMVSKQCSGRSHVDGPVWKCSAIFFAGRRKREFACQSLRFVPAEASRAEPTCRHHRRRKSRPKEDMPPQVRLPGVLCCFWEGPLNLRAFHCVCTLLKQNHTMMSFFLLCSIWTSRSRAVVMCLSVWNHAQWNLPCLSVLHISILPDWRWSCSTSKKRGDIDVIRIYPSLM